MDKDDFYKDLGYVILGSRLKRLSEGLMGDALSLYQELGHDIQPRWFGLLMLLKSNGPLGIVDASQRLGVSQPAVSLFTKELFKKRYITKKKDKVDSRKQILAISGKGLAILEEMQPMCCAVEETVEQLCLESAPNLLNDLTKIETALSNKPLKTKSSSEDK